MLPSEHLKEIVLSSLLRNVHQGDRLPLPAVPPLRLCAVNAALRSPSPSPSGSPAHWGTWRMSQPHLLPLTEDPCVPHSLLLTHLAGISVKHVPPPSFLPSVTPLTFPRWMVGPALTAATVSSQPLTAGPGVHETHPSCVGPFPPEAAPGSPPLPFPQPFCAGTQPNAAAPRRDTEASKWRPAEANLPPPGAWPRAGGRARAAGGRRRRRQSGGEGGAAAGRPAHALGAAVGAGGRMRLGGGSAAPGSGGTMMWFGGSIPAAIAAAKQRSSVFVVFVSGTARPRADAAPAAAFSAGAGGERERPPPPPLGQRRPLWAAGAVPEAGRDGPRLRGGARGERGSRPARSLLPPSGGPSTAALSARRPRQSAPSAVAARSPPGGSCRGGSAAPPPAVARPPPPPAAP